MHNKYFETIDALYDEYVKFWQDVCNIESPTEYKTGVDAVGDYFAEWAKKHGWSVEIYKQEKSGNVVCITMNGDSKGQPICFSGHIDTVHPIGSFGTPAVRTDGDRIYGPGVTDCKGGLVAAALAMDALSKCGYEKRPVMLILQSDEENGSKMSNKATIKYICERAKDVVAFLNLEGHSMGKACTERKGIVTFCFKVKGKAAHSSRCAVEGASAIREAAYKIIELEKIKDNDGLTCNCGLIKGGTAVNSVPDECEFYANVRYATREQYDLICEQVKKLANTSFVEGCTCTAEISSQRLAMEYSERNMELLSNINTALKNAGLQGLEPSKRTGGSDAADVTACGIPCIDSIGVTGGNIHSINEFAQLDSLRQSAKRLVAIAEYI
ncbi:MAG: M20 family metallopeptidase [Ruminococcaceae bacterium]|nr:M20 family metallopeptidase [Oscillospiraceae bacterium]